MLSSSLTRQASSRGCFAVERKFNRKREAQLQIRPAKIKPEHVWLSSDDIADELDTIAEEIKALEEEQKQLHQQWNDFGVELAEAAGGDHDFLAEIVRFIVEELNSSPLDYPDLTRHITQGRRIVKRLNIIAERINELDKDKKSLQRVKSRLEHVRRPKEWWPYDNIPNKQNLTVDELYSIVYSPIHALIYGESHLHWSTWVNTVSRKEYLNRLAEIYSYLNKKKWTTDLSEKAKEQLSQQMNDLWSEMVSAAEGDQDAVQEMIFGKQ